MNLIKKKLSITVDTVGIRHCRNIGAAYLGIGVQPVAHLPSLRSGNARVLDFDIKKSDLKVGDVVLTPHYGPGIIIEVLEIFVDVIVRHNGEVNYLAFAKSLVKK